MRTLLALALTLVAAAAAAAGVLRTLAFEPAEQTEAVRLAPLERRVHASGELRSADTVPIGCPPVPDLWNFTITMLAEEGTAVRTGQPVLAFDPREIRERLEVAQSELDTARKSLEKERLDQADRLATLRLQAAELEARRARTVSKLEVPGELQTRVELEKVRLDHELVLEEQRLTAQLLAAQQEARDQRLAAAENRVASLEREVGDLQGYVARMTVTAPRDGFVVHVTGWNGEKPRAGESVWRGQTLLEIADVEHMQVAVEVPEPSVGLVALEQAAEVRLDASPERLFSGRVVRLGRMVRQKSWDVPSMVFDALVEIDEPDSELMRPGMAATVEILAPTPAPVLQVPERAVWREDGQAYVRVWRDGEAAPAPVELGPRWEGQVVVSAGLEADDRVVVRKGDRE